MSIPQHINYITLGARSMANLRAFYRALGWAERPGSDDGFATYYAGTTLLALYPLQLLTDEAAPGEAQPDLAWKGVTVGINVTDASAVDEAFRSALAAGATAVAAPVSRDWGGYSCYIADPEGNRWEITWAG